MMDDAYSTMYLTWPKVIHRGVPVEIENVPEDEIPTPDQIRCTKVNSPCFQWMNMGMCQHGIYCYYLHDLCHKGRESDNKYNIFSKGTGSGQAKDEARTNIVDFYQDEANDGGISAITTVAMEAKFGVLRDKLVRSEAVLDKTITEKILDYVYGPVTPEQ